MWPVLCAIYTSGGPPRSSIVTSAVPMCYSSPSLMAGGQRFPIMALLISWMPLPQQLQAAPVYAAPEARYPDQHSPKMDTFSYGVLLVEMCVRELPESSPAQREAQILQIQWAAMVSLVRRCTSERPADRPSMGDIMELLGRDYSTSLLSAAHCVCSHYSQQQLHHRPVSSWWLPNKLCPLNY